MKYQHRVLAWLSLLSMITYIDRVCIAVAGPAMQESLGISPQAWGWVNGAFFLSYALFEVPTGAMGDRVGPRRVLTRVVAWWSTFTCLTGLVSSYPLLLFVRFCFGAGEAGAYPNAGIVIARWIRPGFRARAWGIVWMTSQIGAALSPLLIVPIQARYGWRVPFIVFGAVGFVWAFGWYSWFRDWPTEKPGVSRAELHEIGVGAAISHALPWRLALRNSAMWRLMGIGASYVYVIAFFQSWLQTYLVRAHGYSQAALVLSALPYVVGVAANAAGGIVSDWLVQRVGLRLGRRAVGVFGLSFAAIFMAVATLTSSGGWALTFLSLSYAGILLQQPNIGAVAVDTCRENGGVVFGFINSAAAFASVISSIAFGYIAEYFGSYNAPFVPMVVTLAVGCVLWLSVDATRPMFTKPIGARALVVAAVD